MANKFFKKKKGRTSKKTDSDINVNVQAALLKWLDDDFVVAKSNMEVINKDFDDIYDMIHCIRSTKPNDWESNIFFPEFVARLLTQISNFVSKYFGSRDFVEISGEDTNPKNIAEAKASKALLNKLLNLKDSHYYHKAIRMLMFAWPTGWSVMKGGYSQKIEKYQVGTREETTPMQDENGNYLADDGSLFEDITTQRRGENTEQVPIYDNKIVEDRPVFDIYPNQNVYFSPEYTYSLQDKEYVCFERESVTLDEIKDMAEMNGYFNLHMLETDKTEENQAGTKTWNKDGKLNETDKSVSPKFRLLEWMRKFPVVVTERNPQGKPVNGEPGIDKDGDLKEGAENVECIITEAVSRGVSETQFSKLIGFRVSPFTKRPVVRFLAYIDPIRDTGIGDGELAMDLQTAINDNFNLGHKRTQLATTPAFKGKRFSGLPEKVQVSPEQVIMTENMEDLQELQISSDIQGTMLENGVLTSRMDYTMQTSPQTMGMSPERQETATQASIVSQRAEIRMGMKAMNLEFIGFTEFYDMLLSLCNDFMLPQTLEKLIGEDAFNYNPSREDRFVPVSQSLETEESKMFKMRMIDQILGRIVNIPNPKTPMAVNYLLGMWLEAAGGDFKHFKKFMLSEDPEINLLYQLATGGKGAVQGPAGISPGGGPSNQTGITQSTGEQNARAAAGR